MSAALNTLAQSDPASIPVPLDESIPRHTENEPLGYGDLREKAIDLAQAASGALWTDFNLHDPGVTLLEAFCFALTEDVFKARQSVMDLLTTSNGRINHEEHGLHAAPEILPCRPTTKTDYLRWLMDRVPQATGMRMSMHTSNSFERHGPVAPTGLWKIDLQVLALESDADKARAAELAVAADCTRAYWGQRNLCEDLYRPPKILKPLVCHLSCDIEVSGTRAPADILAELFMHCAEYLTVRPERLSLFERLPRFTDAQGVDTVALFDGPRLRNGWIADEQLDRDDAQRVFASDLARELQDIDGLAALNSLSFSQDLAQTCGLQLHWPRKTGDLPKLVARRRGEKLIIADDELRGRLNDMYFIYARTLKYSKDEKSTASTFQQPLVPPQGRAADDEGFISLYANLPTLYQTLDGETLPAHMRATPGGKAQFAAYLALLEQWLAHAQSQGENLHELYALCEHPKQSYWWQMLEDAHLDGLSSLYREDIDKVQQDVFASADAVLERRNRVLDHILALHGETVIQKSLHAFALYFDPQDWAQHLYQLKYLMASRIVHHTRDRYAGIDYSKPSFDVGHNTAPLQERISILLGFRAHHSRSLMSVCKQGLRLQKCSAGTDELLPQGEPQPALHLMVGPDKLDGPAMHKRYKLLSRYIRQLAHDALPVELLRCAAYANRYVIRRDGGVYSLWLDSNQGARGWRLHGHERRSFLESLAELFYQFACAVQCVSEGLHMVEHILLRPVEWPVPESDGRRKLSQVVPPETFYPHQITVVLPGWTARCADPAFRKLALETVQLCCPAHVLPHVLWLDDPDDMTMFEKRYQAWLHAKLDHCQAPDREDLGRSLEGCASSLRTWLLAQHLLIELQTR